MAVMDSQGGGGSIPLSHFKPTLIGWIIFIWVLVLVNKTSKGHVILLYSALLILVFLIVSNYNRILGVMYKPQ